MNPLIDREFAQMELILEERRRELQKPVEPLGITKAADKSSLKLIEKLQRERNRAWFKWRKRSLDRVISKEYVRLEKFKTRTSKSLEAQKATHETEFRRFETLCAELKKPLTVPDSLRDVE